MEQQRSKGLLTVVLPAYNEEASVPKAARVLASLLAQEDIPFELMFIDDGSRDGTWKAIQAQTKEDPRVRGVRFSRNFGKEAAIFAGLAQARGDVAVVSHGATVVFLLEYLLKDTRRDEDEDIIVGNASISTIECDRETGRFTLVELNDRRHLEG